MAAWILPTVGAFIFWGIWAFIPKITVRYISPKSAMVFEVLGAMIFAVIVLATIRFHPDTHPRGILLALFTGILGFSGALCFLYAVSKGPVSLVATLSALYPVLAVILAMLFLHESITLKQGAGIILAVFSILLITS